MNSFGEPLRFNKIEKTKKRKNVNRLSCINDNRRGAERASNLLHSFFKPPIRHTRIQPNKIDIFLCQSQAPTKAPKSTPKLNSAAWDGEDVKSLPPLAPSKRDVTCTLKKTYVWGLLKGHEFDMEKCPFSFDEVTTFSCA